MLKIDKIIQNERKKIDMPDLKKIDVNFDNKEINEGLTYYDPTLCNHIKVYGLNWFEEDHRYVRFPKSSDEMIKGLAEGLYYLVEQPSGCMLAFYSDSDALKIRVKLGHTFNMAHMAFTGQGGCDLYIGTKREDLTFFRTSSYNILNKEYEFTYFTNWKRMKRLFLINLPLYAAVDKIEIGITDGSLIEPAIDLFSKGRIVCYGTSITQGGCASRPGMSYTNALSRRLGYEVLNFGFSGNGRGQKEVATLLSSIKDVSLFILDYEANATLPMLKDTLDNFIDIIRSKYPTTPIVVMSKIRMSVETHLIESKKAEQKSLNFERMVVKKREKEDHNIYFLNGHNLLGKYVTEATVDGCHPTDLGFMLITDYLEKYLKKVLS